VSKEARPQDWYAWHAPYADPASTLTARLREVRRQLGDALDRAPAGPLTLVSLCAGQGLDVTPVLAEHPRGADVRATLIEADERNCEAIDTSTGSVEVVCGDAGSTEHLADVVPVDVLLLCGVFGNVSDEDVRRTVEAVATLCAAGGSVLWTRHTYEPDLTGQLRQWLTGAGVRETAFVRGQVGRPSWSVGSGVVTAPRPFATGHLFTFSTRPTTDLFSSLLDQFQPLGGTELDLPPRSAHPRAADLTA